MHILVVDDEKLLRDSLVALLEDEDHTAIGVATAKEAIFKLTQSPFDMVIVDQVLSDTTGEAFILSVIAQFPRCRFLIHTGDANFTPSEALRSFGFSQEDIVFKPTLDVANFMVKN